MIEKRYPRKLNKSADSRLLAPDEMSDAINISTSEDTRGEGGNAGVIKPVKSNVLLDEGFSEFSESNKTVVGKAICDKYNVIYFFVYEEEGDNGVYAFDPDGYLPGDAGANGVKKIFTSEDRLGYTADSFVKADITYISRKYTAQDGTVYNDSPMIFFTDNQSQPKKLNVLRAIESDYNDAAEGDFILVCHKTPTHSISGSWTSDESITNNEFLGIEGFQFAYQTVYRDGSESAISSYSDIFVPPGYLSYRGQSDVLLLNQNNAISLIIPPDDMSSEVESVKLLTRRGDSGSWFLVKEFDWDHDGADVGGKFYTYKNDVIGSALSADVQSKQFDNVPVRAATQTIIDNRLIYGNYLDGFDNVDLSAEFTPKHEDRPEDFKTYEVTVLPSSCPSPSFYNGNGAQNKNIGFTIDTSELDGGVDAGSFISFSFTVNPKNNFHVYNTRGTGYHQSPQMGEDFSNLGYRNYGIGSYGEDWNGSTGQPTALQNSNINPDTGHPYGFWWQNAEKSGANFIQSQFLGFQNVDGGNIGVPAVCSNGVTASFNDEGATAVGTRFKWRHFDMEMGTSDVGDISDVDFGTSAGNPFIIEGKPVRISCSFTAAANLTKDQVVEAISRILSGELSSRDPENPNEIDLLAENIVYPEGLSYSIDLGLRNGSSVKETSPVANLITMVGTKFSKSQIESGFGLGQGETVTGGDVTGGLSGDDGGGGFEQTEEVVTPQDSDIIKGFFVLNKANVTFGVFRDETYEEEIAHDAHPDVDNGTSEAVSEKGDRNRARFGLYVKEVTVPDDEESILSCMRRPLPGARWWFFAPWNRDGNDEFPAVDNVLLGEGDFREFSLFPWEGGGGLQNNQSFSQALGHNIDSDAAPQNGISEEEQYILIDHPNDGFVQMPERSVFKQTFQPGGSNLPHKSPPWKSVLGGLYYSPQYKTYAESEGREIKFFEGEDPTGTSRYSLMDGKGGPGGGNIDGNSVYDNYVLYAANGPTDDDFGRGIGTFGSAPLFGLPDGTDDDDKCTPGAYGPALSNNIMIATDNGNQDLKKPSFLPSSSSSIDGAISITGGDSGSLIYRQSSLPLIHGSTDDYIISAVNEYRFEYAYIEPDNSDLDGQFELEGSNSLYESQVTNPNANSAILLVLAVGDGGTTSFKAGASHPFGVVFYDDRGRCSNVNPIGSVYVPWYAERTDGKEGATTKINCVITGAAPEGATKFRFVYGGNTTTSRFVQYSTGGAFVSESSDDVFGGNIYVSLNHLQFNPASYAKSYGARGLDGSQDIYTFREGDRLRVISYYENSGLRIFSPESYEFNIVDQVVLSQGDDNPLYNVDDDGNVPHPAKTGSFLVLENNVEAAGFTYDDVKEGGNAINTVAHNWGKRCVVEIYSPKTTQEEESLVYYEIGQDKSVALLNNETDIVGGDVWWKTAPVNFQKIGTQTFESIITDESSDPNFFPYNLEAQSFSDKVRNSDVWSKGKPKIYLPDAERSVKGSTLTYSDKDNPLSKILSLTSFNPAKGQFKDLPSSFGGINYIINNDDSIFVIQSNRCSSIPVNRNLITDGGGVESLVAARQVLGTERYYAGNYGCDDNPESVCNIGNTVYFASKSNRQVYKFNPSSGIEVISDAGMKTYFKKLFERAEADRDAGMGPIKVVGGYDPYTDNYILSVYNQNTDESTCESTDLNEDVEVEVEEVVKVFPESVTISLDALLSKYSDKQIQDIGRPSDPAAGTLDGAFSTIDVLRLLSSLGQSYEPLDENPTYGSDEEGIQFNFPDE